MRDSTVWHRSARTSRALIASTPVAHELAVAHCNIEQWLLLVQSVTAPTVFCPLSKQDTRHIMQVYQVFEEFERSRKFKHKTAMDASGPAPQEQGEGGGVDLHRILPPALSAILSDLEAALTRQLGALRSFSAGIDCEQ